MSGPIATADYLITDIIEYAEAVTGAITAENDAIRERDDHRDALVNGLIGNANPMTNKPHSATSAADAAGKDESFLALDAKRKGAECERIMAWARFEAAKLRAKLAVIAAGGAL
jgi:hypothetical protein